MAFRSPDTIELRVFLIRAHTILFWIGVICLVFAALGPPGNCDLSSPPAPPSVTVLCYLNGDNDLAQEVLHTLDMMETVGSSTKVNVVALVDGHPEWLGPYDTAWSRTRLLRLHTDPRIGQITSPVLEEWGEADMGEPRTLERFVRTALARYPAQRYLFYIFAHSQGVIDTRTFGLPRSAKTLSISRDDSSGGKMALDQFHRALKTGLNGQRFDLMVLFSCLANMVEIGYTLSDVTHYLLASQDEIRLVNRPPGRYQIRGMRIEQMLGALNQSTLTDIEALGRTLIDSHVNDYTQRVHLAAGDGGTQTCRYSGGMALVDTAAMPQLAGALDTLARQLMRHGEEADVTRAIQNALSATQPFASFLNLEYYDLQGFVQHLRAGIHRPQLIDACERVMDILTDRIILYTRQTPDCAATGISIYLSHPLVPDNIFKVHQQLYQANPFSRDTHWDEMISTFRPLLKQSPRDSFNRSQPKKWGESK